jgi:hypothetical protein
MENEFARAKHMAHRIAFGAVAAAALSLIIGRDLAAAQSALPTRPGTCVLTTIARIAPRLINYKTGKVIPNDLGLVISFAIGGQQVSYENLSAIVASRKGDKVYVCLIAFPTDCPPGDNRGRVYTTTNLRTMESWTLPDAENTCGGA